MYLIRCVLSVLLVGAIIGAATFLAGPPTEDMIKHDPAIHPRFSTFFERTRPQIVLIGNSMLNDGVDERLLTDKIQRRTAKLWYGGWASAAWYLAIKNIVVPSPSKPQMVIVFFRDHFLTDPSFRVRGRYKENIERLTVNDEPLLDRLAYLNAMNPFTYWIHQNWSLIQKRNPIKQRLETNVKTSIGSIYGNLNTDKVNQNIKQVFQTKNLLTDQLGAAQLKSEAVKNKRLYDFETSLPKSFLPAMVPLTRENGIRLLFVRVKRRRDVNGEATPAELDRYIRSLEDWLAKEQIPFIDFTHEPALKIEHYGDGDHLNKENGRALFTQLLAEQLKAHLGVPDHESGI